MGTRVIPQKEREHPQTVDLSGVGEHVLPAYREYMGDTHRYLIFKGGAGSGKSHFCAQKILIRCMMMPGHKFLVIRKVRATLRESVFSLIKRIAQNWGIAELFGFNHTDLHITYLPNGSTIIFCGLDDVEKLKSIDGISGIWIEEITECTQDDFLQVDLRLRGRTPSYQQIMASFNPISVHHWLKRAFWDKPDAAHTTRLVTTTYRDNPHVGENYALVMARLKEQDEAMWRIYSEGDWGVLKGLIYGNFNYAPWPSLANPDSTFYAIDFGFNNPMVLMQIDEKDQHFYPRELIYQTEMTTGDLILAMKAMEISTRKPIYCDSAEPDRIQELCNAGFNAIPANKAQNSVVAGINVLKKLNKDGKLHTCAENEHLNKECETYKWQENKDGNVLDEPVKFMDHALDALRYGITSHLGNIGMTGIFVGYDARPDFTN